ncbi:MAG: amino acid permease [Deltaproteobacteria bacterium]|jgi:amino acid transporter/K+/H+ antiporter YhaU regulatory subunit KhtT|nr:amino acid permease [Deltaproteobacteria bacterium]
MPEQISFRRNMGLFMAVMIGIGATMGPGIFALPGELAHMIGPLGVLVYLAMGFLTLFTALNYSELSAAIPLAGGGYSFTHRTLNRPVAFFTGWFFWIGNTLACSMYALIFALTIRAYFIPDASIALLTLITTVVFTIVNFMGMKEAIIVITVMNLVELAVLVGVAGLGFTDIEPINLEPLAPMGWGPFIPAMALIYISYVGFELISNAAEEIIQPGKNIPRAILITLGISTAIYVFVVGVMMGTVNYTELAGSDIPFIFMAERLFGAWGRWAGVIATIMASLSAFSVTLGASARILYALGRDRHFPFFFSKLHPRFQTPHIALFICAVIVIIFGSSGIVKFVASLSDFGYLMGLGIINYAVIPLHKKMPNLRRPFQTMFFPWIPILGVITTWMFVPALELRSFVLGGVLTLVGSAIYLFSSDNRAEVFKLVKFYVKSFKLFIIRLRRMRMRILIISGQKQGQNIADRLLAKDEYQMMFRSAEHQVTFIEESEALCKELEQRYNVPIYQGDGTKKELLLQVGLDNIDVVIAAFEDEGRNVIAALQARQLELEKVVAIVQNHEYTQLLEKNDVVVVNAPWATAAMVENIIDNPVLAQLFEFGIGAASLLEVSVPENANVNGRLIKDIDIPRGCLIAAIIRDNQFVVPRGNTDIEVDDRVIFIGPASAIKQAFELFMLKK